MGRCGGRRIQRAGYAAEHHVALGGIAIQKLPFVGQHLPGQIEQGGGGFRSGAVHADLQPPFSRALKPLAGPAALIEPAEDLHPQGQQAGGFLATQRLLILRLPAMERGEGVLIEGEPHL